MKNFIHKPILVDIIVDKFNIKPGGTYVDCTIGLGGHSQEILNSLENGCLVGFDKDPKAIEICEKKLIKNNNKIILINSDYCTLKEKLNEINITKIDGILFDLGVSSMQLDDAARGFSYRKNGPLDMRMDQNQKISAATIINEYSLNNLSLLIWKNTENKFSRRVAKKIIEKRPIKTTDELVDVLRSALPAAIVKKKHPGRTFFQAFRIEVNNELLNLRKSLNDAVSMLNSKGILQVITFHSLEDRIVKKLFYDLTVDKTKDLPIINHQVFTKKQIKPNIKEIEFNSRSKSATLRILRKIN